MQAILSDYTTAPIDPKLRAMLAFIEKVTLYPAALQPEDLQPLREQGIGERAIEDALLVCTYFNMIARIADALDVAIPSAEGFTQTALSLLDHGYL